METQGTAIRITVNESAGESITLGARAEVPRPDPSPVPTPVVPTPPPPVPSPRAPTPQAPMPQINSPSPPDPSLCVLGNPSKTRAVVPDAPSFKHVSLSPSMTTLPAFDESSLPLPGLEMPGEWGTEQEGNPTVSDPPPHRNDDPWDTGIEEHKTIHLPDPEAQARALQKERDDLLFKLDCLKKQGIDLPKKFNHSSSIEEMRSVYNGYHRSQQMDSGLQITRKLLIGFTGLVEWSNHRFDPLGAKLDGWSTNIMANVEDFDHALLRIWERYGSAMGEINPILELVFAVAMSGVMYHFTQQHIESELRNQEVDRDDPTFQAEVQRAAAEMLQTQQPSQPPRRPPPPQQAPPSRNPPGPAVYTNPEKARRDREQQELREQRASAAQRRQNTIQSFQENQHAPTQRPQSGAPFNPAGLLSGMMGSGGTEQIQELMGGMGLGPQGFEIPNFVPPTPAPEDFGTPAPVTTIPDAPPTPEYNPDNVTSRRRGRQKKSDDETVVDI